MDIYGHEALLSDNERSALGLTQDRPYLLRDINFMIPNKIADIQVRLSKLANMRAMDDDELTHAERASINPQVERLERRSAIIEDMAAQILMSEVDSLTL